MQAKVGLVELRGGTLYLRPTGTSDTTWVLESGGILVLHMSFLTLFPLDCLPIRILDLDEAQAL